MKNPIGEMLTLTRLESVDYPMRPEPVDMAAMLSNLLLEAEVLSAGKHTFSLSIDDPDIIGSKDELRSAFSNLISNAVCYTAGWPRLTERFYRVDKSRSREIQGTGLGLAIVKHVLLRHHGTLGVDSRPGEGSVFTLRLPAASVVATESV